MAKKKKINKKKLLIIIGVFILLVIVGIMIYLFTDNRSVKDIFKYKDKIIIEVGDSLPVVNDYLYKDINSDIEIEWKDIDTEDNKIYKAGIYYGSFIYDNDKKNITLVVEDNTSPIIDGVKDYEILAYETVPDFLDGVTVSDNSKEDIVVTIDGKYDSEKPGTYVMYYKASDSSNNTTSKEFKLVVK